MDKDQSFELYQTPVMARAVEGGNAECHTRDEVDMARLGKKQVLKVRPLIATRRIDVPQALCL